jgi:hypothetical protein
VGAADRPPVTGDPFDLDDDAAYRRWRDWKLSRAPRDAQEIVVEIRDPANPSDAEREAIVERCRRCNMAVYAGPRAGEGKDLARQLGAQLGLRSLDANWLADEDGISTLAVSERGTRRDFIPYTDQPIRWHTDGYYNPPQRRINAMLLHCVERAERGGGNRLLDHEIAYILLRDADPAFVRALSSPEAMLIPQRDAEAGEEARGAQSGPVFSRIAPGGDLHMRYTARTRSIAWRDDPRTRAAVEALRGVLDAAGRWVLALRLEPGMGIVCNNVLHERDGFVDSARHRRTVLRARYHDRIAGTLSSFRDAFAP